MPSVATTLTTRGTLRRRRTTTASVAAPAAPDRASAAGNITQYGMWYLTTTSPKSAAPNAPIWPWAKLMMRLVR